jgi:hypothetical protein
MIVRAMIWVVRLSPIHTGLFLAVLFLVWFRPDWFSDVGGGYFLPFKGVYVEPSRAVYLVVRYWGFLIIINAILVLVAFIIATFNRHSENPDYQKLRILLRLKNDLKS